VAISRDLEIQHEGTHTRTSMTRGTVGALERTEAQLWSELLALATPDEIERAGVFAESRAEFTALGMAATDVLFFNRVLGLGVDTLASAETLDDIVRRYHRAGVQRFFVHLAPGSLPSTLPDWLQERGFVHHNSWAKLFRDTSAVPEAETDLRIERIGRERAEMFALLTAPAFDWPPSAERILARSVGTAGWRHYLAYDGERAVAAAAFRALGNHAYLGPAVTLATHRGRGAQGALIARRIRDAAAAGCRWVVVETAEDTADRPAQSFRNLIRAGFRLAYLRPNYRLDLTDPVADPSAAPR
jgi:hypothetical protein